MRNYVTPHCHIQSLDSASTPAAFVKRELELGTGVVTVTDHGSLAACHTTYELAKKAGLTPILGIEGYFRDDNCPILTAKGVEKKHPKKSRGGGEDTALPKGFQQYVKYHHITLHFQDYAAFQTGIKLLSKAPIELHGSEGKPLFTWHDLQELGATNTTMTTGCLIGMVQRHLLDHEDPVTARQYYEKLRGLVKPGNFYVEAFPHVCSHNWVEGVFLTVKTSNGDSKTLRYYAGKTLKTNVCEIKAEALAAAFKLKSNKHATLIAVKNRSKWEEIEPVEILEVNHNLGSFIQNECGPYSPDGDVQLGANRFVIDLANEYGDPILCSDDAHYAHKEERVVQEVRLAQAGNLRFYGNYHRQSSEEAFAYFNAKLGVKKAEFEKWVDNSHNWAEKFKGFKFTTETSIPSKFFEVNYRNVGASNSLEYTIYLIKKHGRMDWSNPERVARLEQEIKLLYQNGKIDLLPYFFVGELVCDAYRKAGLLTGPGRGSAAGLSLSYYLNITHVDPLRFGLSVDRFLTLDRILSDKLPDLDQDLPNRALLVGENDQGGLLQELFGDHVAQISTQTTLKLKSAVLDVARFKLGEVPKNIAALAHAFEVPPQGLDDDKFVHGYEDAGSWVEGSITRDKALQEYIRLYPEQWEVVKMCLGLGRGVGRHACAYVLANKPISDFIPLTKINGVTCTQFTAAAVEAVGGVKMDFLVLNSLNDISNTLALIKGTFKPGDTIINGIKVPEVQVVPDKNGNLCDIWNLPADQDVFADIAQGKTETVFQFNTPSARNLLHHFAFRNDDGKYGIYSIESMAAFTALDRPGPLDISLRSPDGDGTHNAVVEYARRARGAAPSPDIPPIFNQLFPETHGILCVAEDSMVKTSEGLKPIQSIVPGVMVQTESGDFHAVTRVFNQGVKECVRVRMDGGEELVVTPDHKVLTNFGWAEAGSLTNQHLVRQYWLGENKILEGDDKDWVVGLLLADGDMTATTPTIACSDEIFANEVKRIADKAWGLDSVVVKYGRTWYCRLRHMEKPGTTRNPLTSFLREVGLLGLDCFSKRFPKSVTASMLAGFFEGDGSVVTNRLRIKNENLAREFFYGLQCMKIQSSLKEDGGVWTVSISSQGLPLRLKRHKNLRGGYVPRPDLSFVKKRDGHISYNHKRSKRPYISRKALRGLAEIYPVASVAEDPNPWGRVLSVSPCGLRQVYDLEVSSEHSFVVGGSVVHNCFQEQLQRLYQQVTGCSGAEAEEFRSNVAKKKKEKVLEAYPKFIDGAVRRGLLQKDAEEVWELIGSWARYGFNLSHSVCYAVLAYACAWLKHHYPVQWWCSVLQNATKTDIYETFWDYCKDYVALPSLAGSSKSFSILNGKIQSPYWLIHGIGKVASDELCEIGPFSSITDLARKRHNKKLRDGRSGITQSVVYKLILIGAADSILEGWTPLDGIERFEQAAWEIAQEGKKKPSRIPPKLGKLPEDLGPFGLYQYRKSILPIYSADLLKPLVHHHKEFVKHEDGRFRYKDGTAFTYKGEWRVIANMVPGKDKTIRRAVVAYLEAIESFEFGGTRDPITRKRTGGSKAISLTLDFDGERLRVPCWPDRATGEMPRGVQELTAGDIVVAILSKYNTSKRFSVEKVDIVKKGIGDATEEPETD